MTINSSKKKYISLILLAIAFLVPAGILNQSFEQPKLVIKKQSSALNVDQQFLNFFSMGQNRLIADFLWIVTLLESDHDHYKNKDLNSWLYLRFNSIIGLDPKFIRAYIFGGIYLNMIKDDLYGSEQIFEKGYQKFPDNYHILYNYGYLLAYELKKFKKAVEVYKRLLPHPKAPEFLKSLIVKLEYENTGDLDLAFQLISEMYKNEPEDSPLKIKFKIEMYAIKAEKDLKCLNEDGQDCDYKDFNGDPYILKDGKYISQKDFNKFELYFRKKKKRE